MPAARSKTSDRLDLATSFCAYKESSIHSNAGQNSVLVAAETLCSPNYSFESTPESSRRPSTECQLPNPLHTLEESACSLSDPSGMSEGPQTGVITDGTNRVLNLQQVSRDMLEQHASECGSSCVSVGMRSQGWQLSNSKSDK
ncbi:MAG: hypothetical protein SGPRY_013198, partial [Prymnesium sp.]